MGPYKRKTGDRDMLRLLVDHSIVEAYAQHGRAVATRPFCPHSADATGLEIFNHGDEDLTVEIAVYNVATANVIPVPLPKPSIDASVVSFEAPVDDFAFRGGASQGKSGSIRSGGPGQSSSAELYANIGDSEKRLVGLSFKYKYVCGYGNADDGKNGTSFSVVLRPSGGGEEVLAYQSSDLIDYPYGGSYSPEIQVDANLGRNVSVGVNHLWFCSSRITSETWNWQSPWSSSSDGRTPSSWSNYVISAFSFFSICGVWMQVCALKPLVQ